MTTKEIDNLIDTYHSSFRTIEGLLKAEIKKAKDGILEVNDYEYCVYITTFDGVSTCRPIRLICQYSPFGDNYFLTDDCGYSHPLSAVSNEDKVSLYTYIRKQQTNL